MHSEDDQNIKYAPPWEELGRGTRKIPKGASEILKNYFDEHQIEMAGEYHSFFSSWEQIAGIDIAAHSFPRDITNHVLVVEADHPGWMQMISIKKNEIIEKIRRLFPQLQIRNMRVVLFSGTRERRTDQNSPQKREIDSIPESKEEDRPSEQPVYERRTDQGPESDGSGREKDATPESSGDEGERKRLDEALKKLGREINNRSSSSL